MVLSAELVPCSEAVSNANSRGTSARTVLPVYTLHRQATPDVSSYDLYNLSDSDSDNKRKSHPYELR